MEKSPDITKAVMLVRKALESSFKNQTSIRDGGRPCEDLAKFSHTKTLLEKGNTNKIRCLLKNFSSNLNGAFRRTWSCLRRMYHYHRISYLGMCNFWIILLRITETDQWNFGISQLYFL